MRIRISSVVCEEVLRPIVNVITNLESSLNEHFAHKVFGPVDQFVIAVISVDSDALENEKFAKKHNSSGSYKDPFSGDRVKFFSIAVKIDPDEVVALNDVALRIKLCEAFIEAIAATTVKIPKGFDFGAFANELTLTLEIYKRAVV